MKYFFKFFSIFNTFFQKIKFYFSNFGGVRVGCFGWVEGLVGLRLGGKLSPPDWSPPEDPTVIMMMIMMIMIMIAFDDGEDDGAVVEESFEA